MTRPRLLALFALCATFVAGAADVPAWRDATPGARFLGPDRYWRMRDTLLWHLLDDAGTGFRLNVDVRDMNTYLQGPRAVSLVVTGPQGRILAHRLLEDDGIVDGDQEHHDGIPDMYGDIRYRAWHRHHSPGGTPPERSRSPYLADPGSIPARTVTLTVPAAGPGRYRLLVVGTWDHWVSVTPDRALAAAIHPGPAPLPMHADQLADVWLYAPANVQDIGLAINEEVAPWNWGLTVSDEAGTEVARIVPKTAFNFTIIRGAKPDSLYHLRFTGTSTGACLHLGGAPLLLAPDADTARKLHAGMQIDKYGRATYHEHQRVMLDWAYSLTPADLAADLEPVDPKLPVPGRLRLNLGHIRPLLDAQILDPADPKFGDFAKTGDDAIDKQLSFWNPAAGVLSRLVGFDDPANPWYGNPALVRRVMLYFVVQRFATQNAWFWFDTREAPKTYPETIDSLWAIGLRSNWYPLQDAQFTVNLGPIREATAWSLPAAVNAAWVQAVRCWALGRLTAQQGECTNQWAKGLEALAHIYLATRDPIIQEALTYQSNYFCTPGVLGRVNPDPNPWSSRSAVGYAGLAADSGVIGGAIPAEQFGHDGEYALETVSHLSEVHRILPNPRILEWLNQYYVLKTHLTMPRSGTWPKGSFTDTVSPSDTNFRTRYYTHKSGLSGAEHEVIYGDIWAGEKNAETPWPVFEAGDFLRTIDDRYSFLKTPGYYAIIHTGPAAPWYGPWTQVKIEDGSIDWIGYGGMHYGGLGMKASKLGAISGLWVPDCGIVWSCQNHNVMYTNAIWGRRREPLCEKTEEGVDNFVVSEGYNQPDTHLDPETHILTKVTRMMYVPLTVSRRIVFGPEAIDVTATVTANEAVDMQELYEAVPVYTQARIVRVYGDGFAPLDWEEPEAITTPAKAEGSAPPVEMWGEMPDFPRLRLHAFDVTNKAGAGALVVFDRPFEATTTQPIRYRDVAAATGGFNLVLPAKLAKDQTVTVRYRIVPHREPLSPEQIQQAVPR